MLAVFIMTVTLPVAVFSGLWLSGPAYADRPEPVPRQVYGLYDRIITEKFLASSTQLLLIRRTTGVRTDPAGQKPSSIASFFESQPLFEGQLSDELVADFVRKSQRPSHLEPYFDVGVPYRLVADEEGDAEVSLAAHPVSWVDSPLRPPDSILGVLEFSRVAWSQSAHRALVYVGIVRRDGTGGGMLVLLASRGGQWTMLDSEVIWWVIRPEDE